MLCVSFSPSSGHEMNVVVEDSSQYQATAEVPVDVLFSAFEKFLHNEWANRMGLILPPAILQKMQVLFGKLLR